jgi:N utilization substance protein B
MLFQLDLIPADPAEVFAEFWSGPPIHPDTRKFAEALVCGVYERRDELDGWIVAAAQNWRIERMAVVDRNVLRMAVYEMLAPDDTPGPVIIDEAIEVAKKFGSEESGGFINGILDSIRKRIGGERS